MTSWNRANLVVVKLVVVVVVVIIVVVVIRCEFNRPCFFFFFFFYLVVSMEKLGNKFASHHLDIWPFFNSEGRRKVLDQRYNLFLHESYDQHQ